MTDREPWVMPAELGPYDEFLNYPGRTEELLNTKATAQSNLIVAAMACEAGAQISLLARLRKAGLLRGRDAALPREQVATKLFDVAAHRIVAEWICCEPLNPRHRLCAKGYVALEMIKGLLVDDPEAASPAPLLDAVVELIHITAKENEK